MTSKYVTIKNGDTFWGLEKKLGIPTGTLQKLNPKLDPKRLRIGQEVIVQMPDVVYLFAKELPKQPSLRSWDKYSSHFFKKPVQENVSRSSFLKQNAAGKNGKGFMGEAIETSHKFASTAKDILDTHNLIRPHVTSNALFHLNQHGMITYRWDAKWANSFMKYTRAETKILAQGKQIAPKLLSKVGTGLFFGEILLSGEIKPSHAVGAVLMLGALPTIAAATPIIAGGAAILGGVIFVTDALTDMGILDDFSLTKSLNKNFKSFEMYDGLY